MHRRFRRRPPKAAVVLVIVVLIIAARAGWHVSFRPQRPRSPESLAEGEYHVVRVVDGDTIIVTPRNSRPRDAPDALAAREPAEARVRLLGIDTPETKHPYKPVQFFGHEASQFNSSIVEGKQVILEYDAGRRDRYNRLLAYVYVGDMFVNAELVAQGYAQTATYAPNVRYQELFLYLQKQAREAGMGLWSRSYPADDTTVRSGGKYLGSKKSDVYHYPGCKWAMKISTDNAIWFDSAAQARAAGYRPCRVCKPPE